MPHRFGGILRAYSSPAASDRVEMPCHGNRRRAEP